MNWTLCAAALVLAGTAAAQCPLPEAGRTPPAIAERLEPRLAAIDTAIAAGGADIVALGDSIVQRWPDEVLAEALGGGRLLNAGVGGDGAADLLIRLQRIGTEVQNGVEPRLVYVMIGSNDLARAADPCSVVEGIEAVLGEARRIWPGAEIVVGGILPRRGPARMSIGTEVVNAALAEGEADNAYRFAPLGAAYTQACPDLAACPLFNRQDGVHPTPEGYDAIADELAAALDRS